MGRENNKQLSAVIMLTKSIQNRKMILQLAKNDFKTRYAGSYFGIFWAFVQPIVTILLYWFVFQMGFRSQPVGDYPFVLWLTAGLVPWFFFSDAWNGATSALLGYSFLVKKVVFDIEVLPAIKIVAAFLINVFFTAFMLLLFILCGYYPDVHWLQVIYCFICIIVLTWGLGYLTSSVVVFVRDLGHLLSVALQVLMWLTPIMWNIEMIAGYPWLVKIMHLNPVFYIVQCYRDAVFQGVWFWQRTEWTIYFWVVTLLMFAMGSSVFRRLQPHFADVL
jgi:teichoic acid transport system permease protein